MANSFDPTNPTAFRLTPEQIAQLGTSQSPLDIGGYNVSPWYSHPNGWDGGDTFGGYTLASTDPEKNRPGGTYYTSGADGQGFIPNEIMDGGKFKLSDFKDLGQAAALLGGFALGGNALGAALGGTGGLFGAAGAGAGTGAGYGIVGGATEPAASLGLGEGLGAAGTTAATTAGMTAAGVTGLPSGIGADLMYGGGADLLPGASGVAGSTLGGGASLSSAAGAGSLFNSLKPWIGPAATLLGGLLGSKGVKKSETRDMPDWLKPYVVGQGGLLDRTQSQFNSTNQWLPTAMTQQRGVATGLLNGTTKFGRG